MTKAIRFPVRLKQVIHTNSYIINSDHIAKTLCAISFSILLSIFVSFQSTANATYYNINENTFNNLSKSISAQQRANITVRGGGNTRNEADRTLSDRANVECARNIGMSSDQLNTLSGSGITFGEITNVRCEFVPRGGGYDGVRYYDWHRCSATARCLTRAEVEAVVARRQAERESRERAEAASRQRAQEEQRRQQAAAAAQQRAAQERRAREAQERQREEEERLRQEEEARLLAEAERAQREEEDRLRREAEEAERARREELAQAGLEAVNRCNPPIRGNARWLGLGVSVEPGMYVSSHYPRGGDFSRPENYACHVMSPLAACEGLMCSEAVRIRMDHMVERDVGEGALRNHGTCYDVAVRRVSAEMRYSPVPSRANIEQDGFTEPSSLFGPLRAARDAEWNARVNHVERMFRSAHQENVTRVAQCLESAGFNFQGQSLQEFDMWGTPLDLVREGEEGGARPGDPG